MRMVITGILRERSLCLYCILRTYRLIVRWDQVIEIRSISSKFIQIIELSFEKSICMYMISFIFQITHLVIKNMSNFVFDLKFHMTL